VDSRAADHAADAIRYGCLKQDFSWSVERLRM